MCAGFLWLFHLESVFCAATSALGRRGSGKLSFCTQKQKKYCLACQRNWEVKTQEDRTDRRAEKTQGKLVNTQQFWVLNSTFWVIYVSIFNLGKLKLKTEYKVFSGIWKREDLRMLILFTTVSWCTLGAGKITISTLSLGGTLSMMYGELSVSSAADWEVFFMGVRRCVYVVLFTCPHSHIMRVMRQYIKIYRYMYKSLSSVLWQDLLENVHNDLNSKDKKYRIAHVHLVITTSEMFLNNNK